jgi:hypothetical protein
MLAKLSAFDRRMNDAAFKACLLEGVRQESTIGMRCKSRYLGKYKCLEK